MVRTEVLTASLPIVDRLYKTGYTLVAGENSPVAALNVAAYTPMVDLFQGEAGFTEEWLKWLSADNSDKIPASVSGQMHGDDYAVIPTNNYANTLEAASNVVGQACVRAMNFAKNTATPIITSVTESIEEQMTQDQIAIEDGQIIEFRLSSVWDDGTIFAAYNHHQHPIETVTDVPVLPLPENLSELLMSGSATVDQAYMKLLGECGLTVEDAFTQLFSAGRHGDWPQLTAADANNVLVKFLTASMLFDNPVIGSGLSGTQWETLLGRLQNAYGALCVELRKFIDGNREIGQLVYNIDYNRRIVLVDGIAYDAWIDQGGTPEIILGSLYGRVGDLGLYSHYLLEHKDVMIKHWEVYHASKLARIEADRTNRFKVAIRNAVLKEIAEYDEALYAPLANQGSMIECLDNCIRDFNHYHLNDIPLTIVDVVCKVLFPHTPTKFIITRLSQVKDSGVNQSTAEMMVITEYITHWLLDATSLVKASTKI